MRTSRLDQDPPVEHRASAGCYAIAGEVLARDYSDPDYYRLAHQIVVDAYAAQHGGGSSRREVQTVALCLMTLCLFIEQGVAPEHGPSLHQRMTVRRPQFTRLEPPDMHGLMTVADLLPARDAAEHARLALKWGGQVWGAYKAHHETVRAWNRAALGDAGQPGPSG